MKKWEYTIAALRNSEVFKELEVYGAAGWELVAVINYDSYKEFYFKRPKT